MKRNPVLSLLLILFIITIGGLFYFQYKSYQSVRQLIGSNEELLYQINYKNKFQLLQTHLATFDKLVRESVITKGAVEGDEIRNQIAMIDSTMDYIDDERPYEEVNELSARLDSLVDLKIDNGIDILNEYNDKGKQEAELLVYEHNKQNTSAVILSTIKELEKLSEQKVRASVNEIDTNERKAMWMNIVIAGSATFLLTWALIYILLRIRLQQKLIFQLNEAKDKEKKAAKIKEDFLANMSHEIRTPLNAILGFTSLLEQEPLDEKASQFVQTIRKSGTYLLELVNEILDIAKIEEGMLRIERQVFHLEELVHTIANSFAERIREKGLAFEVSVGPVSSDEFLGDAYRLTQILNNLLSNALKFTAAGKITLQVQESFSDTDNCRISFSVRDSGIGIAAAALTQIFERFEQGDPAVTRQYGGTGLGLSIVKQLVDLQQGRIHVESIEGEGSIFTVELPFGRPVKKKMEALVSSKPKLVILPPDLHLLVVEDNPVNQQLLAFWFNNRHLNYTIASNGEEAIRYLRKESFNLMLLDIQMPLMDGYEVCRILREEMNLTIPVIAMTAHALFAEKVKCLLAGMDNYLSKPLSETELLETLVLHTDAIQLHVADRLYLQTISNGDDAFTKRLLEQFLQQSRQELTDLSYTIERKEDKQFRSIIHGMKTTFGYLGLTPDNLKVFERLEQEGLRAESMDLLNQVLDIYLFARHDCTILLNKSEQKDLN